MRKSLFILSVLLTISAVSFAQARMKQGYVTYTIDDIENARIRCKWPTPNYTCFDFETTSSTSSDPKYPQCSSAQGMAVGKRYIYVAKVGGPAAENYEDCIGVVYRIDTETGRRVIMRYHYDPTLEMGHVDKNNASINYPQGAGAYEYSLMLGHANEMEIVEYPDGSAELFVSTGKRINGATGGAQVASMPAIVRFKVVDEDMYLVDSYELKNGNGTNSFITASAMKYIKTVDDEMYFLVKNALNFYTLKIPKTPNAVTSGVAINSAAHARKLEACKLFVMDLHAARYVKEDGGLDYVFYSNSGDRVQQQGHADYATDSAFVAKTWANQGFGYSAAEQLLYVPLWRNEAEASTTSGKTNNPPKSRSVILTYDISDFVKDSATIATNWGRTLSTMNTTKANTKRKPTKTVIWIKHPTDGKEFEIESSSFRTDTEDNLYFNTNADTQWEGVYLLKMGLMNEQVALEGTKYHIVYDANGGEGIMASTTKNVAASLGTLATDFFRANAFTRPAVTHEYEYVDENGVTVTVEPVTRTYKHDGWYAHRLSDEKWLYQYRKTGASSDTYGWFKKGEQPNYAFLALLKNDLTVNMDHDLTDLHNDTIVLYAFWKPESKYYQTVPSDYDATTYRNAHNYYYIRYDGNGGFEIDEEGDYVHKHGHLSTLSEIDQPVKYLSLTDDQKRDGNYPDRSIAQNIFTREGYEMVGWTAFREHYGEGATSQKQWAFIRVDPTTGEKAEEKEPWTKYSAAPTTNNVVLKTYDSGNASVWSTTTVDGDVVTFYAQWIRLKDEVLPANNSILPLAGTFDIAGMIDCTTDIHSFDVNIRNKADNSVVQTHTEELWTKKTSIVSEYEKGIPLETANATINFEDLSAGDYIFELIVHPFSGNLRSYTLHQADFTIEPDAFKVAIPSGQGNDYVVELANPNYLSRSREDGQLDAQTGTSDAYYLFSARQNSWYEFTDPQRIGYTFMGWKSVHVTNNQYLTAVGDIALGFSKTTPTNFTGNRNDYVNYTDLYSIDYEHGVSGQSLATFDDEITVNVWAKMNWNDYTSGMRILSCTEGGGFNIGETRTEGMVWQVYDADKPATEPDKEDGGYRGVKFSKLWKNLGDGWHMFTLTFGHDGTNRNARGYVDAGTVVEKTSDNYTGKIGIRSGVGLMIGGETNLTNGLQKDSDPFKGDIASVVVTKIWNSNTTQHKNNIRTYFKDRYKTYLYTSDIPGGRYVLEPIWAKNEDTYLLFDEATLNADGIQIATALDGTHAPSNTSTLLGHPTRKDYRFVNWTNTASHFVSSYQGIPYLDKDQNSVNIFTCPAGSSEANEVTFEGEQYYYIDNATEVDYRHEDAFTINVWATMADWTKMQTEDLRLFSSISNDLGFALKPSSAYAGDDRIVFLGNEYNSKNEKRAVLAVTDESKTWTSLNNITNDETANWHMFTFVFDGNYIRGYINGQCVAISERFESGKMAYDSSTDIVIGAEATTTAGVMAGHFKGKMKNFAILHTALTPIQVQTLYSTPAKMQHYYYAPVQHTAEGNLSTTLGANWELLPTFIANDTTIHVIAGDGAVAFTMDVMGDGVNTTQPEVVRGNGVNFAKHEAIGESTKVNFTYTPLATYDATTIANNTHTITYKLVSEGWTTTPQETITAINHRFDIAYWNKQGFAVQADADLAACEVTIKLRDDNGSVTVLTTTVDQDDSKGFVNRGDGTYEITLTGKAANLSDKDIEITFDHPDGWRATTTRSVPKFITTGNDEFTTINKSHCDVMIMGTAEDKVVTLSADLSATPLGDVYIHPEATLKLVEGAKVNANSIVLYSEKDQSPSLVIPHGSQLTLTTPTIYYVKRIENDRWYFFSLPYKCSISEIRFADGSIPQYGTDYWIQKYDGAERVKNNGSNTGWVHVTESTLEAGVGYCVGIADKYTGEHDLVFPMKLSETDANRGLHAMDNELKTIPIEAHGITGVDADKRVAPHHLGWNLIGNPYFTTYAYHDDDALGKVKVGTAIMTEQDNDGMMYMTIPYEDWGYYQTVFRTTDIPSFSTFYVQAAENGSITFVENRPKSIVARKAQGEPSPKRTYASVTLSNEVYNDETSLVIGNQFTQDYEIGSDLVKMLGLGSNPQVYIHDAAYDYAFKSLSEADAAGTNDLGTYFPATGEYTFAANESFDYSELQAIHLTDKQEGVTVDLLQAPYTFTSNAEHTTKRFALSAVLSANVTTELTSGTAVAWSVWQDAPLHIQVQGLASGDEVRIFDCMGRLIMQFVTLETTAAFSLPMKGAYCLQTIGAQGVQVKKILVK